MPPETHDNTSPTGLSRRVRQWLSSVLPREWIDAADRNDRDTLVMFRRSADAGKLWKLLGDSGFGAPTWPVEYGGLALSEREAHPIYEELARAGFPDSPNGIGMDLAGPILLRWGTDQQKKRFVRRIITHEDRWCELFSEPGAGSDLAGLSTRAVRDGAAWRITGQKVWSSLAHQSDYGLLIGRTNPDVPKHEGITAFIIPMKAPGVEVRPLRQMTGDADFNEVFLTDVRVPDEHRVGAVDGGWTVARSVLAQERSAGRGRSTVKGGIPGRSVESVIEHYRPITDPEFRGRVVQAWIDQRAAELLAQRVAETRRKGESPGPEGSMVKVISSEYMKRLHSLLIDIEGRNALAYLPDDDWAAKSAWLFLRVQAKTISAGTNEIQRNIIAERLLGMPRETPVDKGVPWKDVRRS